MSEFVLRTRPYLALWELPWLRESVGVFCVLRTQNTPTYPVRHGDSQRADGDTGCREYKNGMIGHLITSTTILKGDKLIASAAEGFYPEGRY